MEYQPKVNFETQKTCSKTLIVRFVREAAIFIQVSFLENVIKTKSEDIEFLLGLLLDFFCLLLMIYKSLVFRLVLL